MDNEKWELTAKQFRSEGSGLRELNEKVLECYMRNWDFSVRWIPSAMRKTGAKS